MHTCCIKILLVDYNMGLSYTWLCSILQAGNNVLHVSPSIGSIDTLNESEVLMSSQKEIYKGKPSIVLPILGCICLLILYITCGAAFVADTQNIEFR